MPASSVSPSLRALDREAADGAQARLQAVVEAHGLREIDELVRDGEARGFVVLQASGGVLDAVTRHVERRARALGRPLIKIDGLPADDPWRELTARLQSPGAAVAPAADALAAAQAILDRAGPALVLVREGAGTCFGRALATELARLSAEGTARTLLIVLTEETSATRQGTAGETSRAAGRLVEVEAEVSADERQLWWEAIARDPAHGVGMGLDRLDVLESWWAAACATPLEQRAATVSLDALGAAARRLLVRLALSQRSWLASQIGRMGTLSAAQELVRVGALTLDLTGRLVAGPIAIHGGGDTHTDLDDVRAVAAALDALNDPWAAARASELHASAGAFEQAEASAERAVSAIADSSARADFWRRWARTLAELPEAEALPRLLRSVDLALRSGDVERALDHGGAALSRRPDSFVALLALGRTNVARGDLSTASYWLGKAMSAAGTGGGTPASMGGTPMPPASNAGGSVDAASALVLVELAEVRLLEGDTEGARRHAALALATPAADAATHLHARNVLGKPLRAGGWWAAAEAHFAADACEAALSGDLSAELRARLNRSIALLSSGRLDDARGMLGAVLDEGEARGELRAVAYALTNLATIATLKREYVEALRLSERAFEARRRLGDKVTLALLITNIAELKLQLGMVSEAEQALAFGRQACGPGMPGSRASHFAITAALIHFERGRTVEAGVELKKALSTARCSPHGARLGECWRLSARIALEDGDLAAAETALGHAAASAESPRERAWVAVLEAARARAGGEPFGAAAEEALDRARAADDADLCREAHLLLHHAAAASTATRDGRACTWSPPSPCATRSPTLCPRTCAAASWPAATSRSWRGWSSVRARAMLVSRASLDSPDGSPTTPGPPSSHRTRPRSSRAGPRVATTAPARPSPRCGGWWGARPPCSRCRTPSSRWARATPPSSSTARAAPGRSSSPRPSTRPAPGAPARWSR